MDEAIQTTGCERDKKVLEQNMGTKRFKKVKWINIETELQMLKESPQVNIHSDGIKATLKENQTGKPLA